MGIASVKYILITGATIILNGCVTTEPDYQWVKTEISNEQKEYTVADSSCLAEAYEAAPLVPVANCLNMSGFESGFCKGSNSKQRKTMNEVRAKIYDGCMLNKGWEKQSIQ